MSNGLATTLETLTKTTNAAADAVLLPALNARDPFIQEGALIGLLERKSVEGGREILRRLPLFTSRWKQLLFERRSRLSKTLREAILGTDPTLIQNSFPAVVWFREYDLIAALLNLIEDTHHVQRDRAARTMLELVDLLYNELAGPRDYAERRDPQLMRKHVVATLEHSVARFSQHKSSEVLEAFATLAESDNALLKQILTDPLHNTYVALVEVLHHSSRPGVARLLLSYLDENRPPSAALSLIGRRGDVKFVRHLAQRVGDEVSPTHVLNLKRIEAWAWAAPEAGVLAQLDDAPQSAAAAIVMCSGYDRRKALKTIQYLLQHGTTGGRRTAARLLAEFNGVEANALAQVAVDDPDPIVQAHILRQIRGRGVPGALPRLLAAVDSAHEEVRAAARECLAEFSFSRFLASYSGLDDNVQRSTGRLVRKIDLQALPQLRTELESLSRNRRLRALGLVPLLDAAADVESQLLDLLEDEDHVVREQAVRALANSPTARAQDAVRGALNDRSHRVREAVNELLGIEASGSASAAQPTTPEQPPQEHDHD
ncbi:MAG: HEAT repeat domain-containing protein [Pirellulales bacterium]|nr:HEAT repeat domain-containing protein [Pirellulales bacterium]